MAGNVADVVPKPRSGQVRSRPPVVLPSVMAAGGAAFAVLTGLDGSPTWRTARVLAVVTVTVLAVWFTRRTERAGRGATALLLGIVGTAAGAGIATADLAKAGLDAAAVLAIIVLATGLFLLGWGAVALVRETPGWWRLLAVPVALALAAPRPMLIIAGGASADEPTAARWFQAAAPATVQVWIVPGAGHTQGLATAPRAWQARVTGFLDRALRPQR